MTATEPTAATRGVLPPRSPQLMERLVAWQRKPAIGRFVRQLNLLLGVDIPPSVHVGADFRLYHRAHGTVIHPNTRFGDRCRVFHAVTVGRSAPWLDPTTAAPLTVEVGDDAWLCTGAVILAKDGQALRIGRGTVVAANAVLTRSTGEWEVWAGNPARKVAHR